MDLDTVCAILADTPVDDRFSLDLQGIRHDEKPVEDPGRDG